MIARERQPVRKRRTALWLVVLGATWLTGCSTLSSWLPSWLTEPPSWPSWLSYGHGARKPGPLPEFAAKTTARVNWQASVGGKVSPGFAPAVRADAIFAAAPDGTLLAVDPASGTQRWRVNAGKPLSAGIGSDTTAVVVGTVKGDVLAFDMSGKPLWQTKVSSEVIGPPKPADGMVVVWSIDGKIFALSESDGARKWVYQRATPPLTVRRFAGGVVSRGGLFTGTPGGKLLGIDLETGALAWEGNVTTPKGATELERIADITSLPVVDDRLVCAAAYLGRVACFDVQRGALAWSRDFGSLGGLALDNRYLYLTDDKGAIQALDKSTGASVWKQDKLAARFPSGPARVGAYVGIVDGEGYLHLLDPRTGALVGRVATDGSAPLAQPYGDGDVIIWQSAAGNLFSVGAR